MSHNLPGEILTTEWNMDNTVVAYGFHPADYNEAALQGIHAPNLLIVVDSYWPQNLIFFIHRYIRITTYSKPFSLPHNKDFD